VTVEVEDGQDKAKKPTPGVDVNGCPSAIMDSESEQKADT